MRRPITQWPKVRAFATLQKVQFLRNILIELGFFAQI